MRDVSKRDFQVLYHTYKLSFHNTACKHTFTFIFKSKNMTSYLLLGLSLAFSYL